MPNRTRSAAAAALLLAATAACADAPSTAPDRSTPDVARAVSTAIDRTVAVAFGTLFPGADPVALPAACPYEAADGAFVCTPAAIGELSYTLTYHLLDADGRALDTADERATTLRAVIERRGARHATTNDGGVTTTLAERSELLVSGLQRATLTLAGTSTTHREVSGDAGNAPRTVEDIVGATNVVFDDGARWPRTGTITASAVTNVLTPALGSPTTLRTRSAIAFDGTSVVTITTETETYTLHCRFDLAGRQATTCA